MATEEEGGGGGAGGKFRKKPFRRQTTPYDRPPIAIRGNNVNNNSSWLAKLVVEPASKLVSYGADRLFASILRRRLPPLPPPQPPEANADVSDWNQGADLNSQDGAQVRGCGDCIQPINSSSSNGVAELEQLLRQKTFTRLEIAHLTELLHSRAVEVFPVETSQKNEDTSSDFGRHQDSASGPLEVNRTGGIRPPAVVSTPIQNPKVLENDITSPAELAKAYMGSRPSKVSPSVLGMRSQLGREDTGLLTNTAFASKLPIMSLTKKASVSVGAPENGLITTQSRGRSAIYNMARTPYSRVHHTSTFKGSGINNDGYAGPSASSSSLPLVRNDEKFESQPVTLKRGSSVLDDEVGSVGPIRRMRLKPNSLGPKIHHTSHGVGIGSYAKQKLQLIGGEPRNKVLKNTGENGNECVPSTSFAHVPSKSSEVAARILEELEKLTPKEKTSESKLVAVREKSPLRSTPSVLSGQNSRNREDVGSSKLLLDVHDDHKFGHQPRTILPYILDSSPQKQREAEENDPKASVIPSGPVWNNDSAVSLKASTPNTESANSVANDGASQPPQKKRAFRMSAEEDSLEQDDVQCNGFASGSLSEMKGPAESSFTDGKPAPAEEPKLPKTTTQVNELSPGVAKVGERTSFISSLASVTTQAISQSEAFASSLTAFNKTKGANSSLINFASEVADKFPSLPSESFKRPESELGSSSGLVNISAPTGHQAESLKPDKGFHVKLPKTGDINGKWGGVSSAESNVPLVSSCYPVSFSAASSGDTNHISTSSGLLFTSSTSITKYVPTISSTHTSATSSGSNIVELVQKHPGLDGPAFKFGSSLNSSTSVSAAFTTTIPEVAGRRTKVETIPSFGNSNSSHSTVAALGAVSSGSSTFGLDSSVSCSTGNNLEGSLFASASKSLVSGAENGLQGTSGQSVSSTLLPAFNVNTSTSLGSSPSPSSIFGFSSTSCSSDTSALLPFGGPTSSLYKFGAGSDVSSSTTPGILSFGLSSSSNSTFTVGSGSGATPSISNFGSTSSASASVINTGSSFSNGTSGIFNLDGSSSAASSTVNAVSLNSAPSNVFCSSWQSPKSSLSGSTFTSPSPTTGFSFGAPSKASASTNTAAIMVFNSSTIASSSPIFSFTTASAPASSSPSLSAIQPVFGNPPIAGGFAASPGNNDKVNAEDSMVEDPAPSSTPVPMVGQPSVPLSPPGFTFGSTVPSQTSPFIFSGQQNQAAPQNPSPFQASGSLEFNAGGSFSLGSGGGDKSGRKIVKINRNKNRKR